MNKVKSLSPYVTVITPIYNEEKNIKWMVRAVSEKLISLGCSFEILIIDDGSIDNSVAIIKDLMSVYSFLRLYQHKINMGAGSGILTGIKESLGDYIIFIPADIAMDLNHLSKYMEASKSADVVVGLRSDRQDYSFFRKIISFINIWVIKNLFKMPQRQFNYICLYKRSIFQFINVKSRSVFVTAEIIIRSHYFGFKVVEVDISYLPRKQGKPAGASLRSIIKTIKDMIIFWLEWKKIKFYGEFFQKT